MNEKDEKDGKDKKEQLEEYLKDISFINPNRIYYQGTFLDSLKGLTFIELVNRILYYIWFFLFISAIVYNILALLIIIEDFDLSYTYILPFVPFPLTAIFLGKMTFLTAWKNKGNKLSTRGIIISNLFNIVVIGLFILVNIYVETLN